MKKKILIVGLSPFYPVLNGSMKVVYEYCKLLKELGNDVYYCNSYHAKYDDAFCDFMEGKVFSPEMKEETFVSRRVNKLKRRFIDHHKYKTGFNFLDDLFPNGLGEYVAKLNTEYHFDVCIVNYIIISKLLDYIDCPRKVIFTHDAFTNKHELLNLNTFWFSLTPDEEAKGIRRATDILSIQNNESVLYHYYNPLARIYTVYSPFPVTRQEMSGNNNILFISGNNQLNQNGIDYFLQRIFPIIVERNSEVKLIVGGKICDYLRGKKNTKNIELLGIIDDESSFYSYGDIAINPIYQGTGLKVKTFEALSFGKVTVAHPHSVDGIFEPSNAPILVGHTEEEFARQILMALDDVGLRKQISDKAIRYMQNMNNYIRMEYERLLDF
ncbi:MAG: glycosyltransferase family 4 protein [Bacteroidales bacterium]|nr:glycosyltransferase family 4 protein [Bacteroidales bacterium]